MHNYAQPFKQKNTLKRQLLQHLKCDYYRLRGYTDSFPPKKRMPDEVPELVHALMNRWCSKCIAHHRENSNWIDKLLVCKTRWHMNDLLYTHPSRFPIPCRLFCFGSSDSEDAPPTPRLPGLEIENFESAPSKAHDIYLTAFKQRELAKAKANHMIECPDCSRNAYARNEYFYMLKDSVWGQIDPGGTLDLCITCAETRLGRKLAYYDFDRSSPLTLMGYVFSPILRSRIQRWRRVSPISLAAHFHFLLAIVTEAASVVSGDPISA
jgi:hypothetical protein